MNSRWAIPAVLCFLLVSMGNYTGGLPGFSTDELDYISSRYIYSMGNDGITSTASSPDGTVVAVGYIGDASPYLTHLVDGTGKGLIILKMFENGTILWATEFGSSVNDYPMKVVVNPIDLSILVVGITFGDDFTNFNSTLPTPHPAEHDGFITHFNSSGFLKFSSRFGGDGGDDYFTDAGFGPDGQLVVVGYTGSLTFPILSAADPSSDGGYEGIVLSLDNNYSLQWATYLGGSGVDGDYARSVIVTSSGDIIVTGETSSGNFPAGSLYSWNNLNGVFDGYLATFNTTGHLLSTFLFGGNGEDYPRDLLYDDVTDRFYVVGNTNSANLPSYQGDDVISDDGTYLHTQTAFVTIFELGLTENTIYVSTVAHMPEPGDQAVIATDADFIFSFANGPELVIAAATQNNNLVFPKTFDDTHNGNWDVVLFAYNGMNNFGVPPIKYNWGTYLGGGNDDAFSDSNLSFTDFGPTVSYLNDATVMVGGTTQDESFPFAENDLFLGASGPNGFIAVLDVSSPTGGIAPPPDDDDDGTFLKITGPDDISFIEGTAGWTIDWRLEGESPLDYYVTRDGDQMRSGQWTSGQLVRIELNDLEVGEYLFEITATNNFGDETSDVVRVTVTPSGDEPIDEPRKNNESDDTDIAVDVIGSLPSPSIVISGLSLVLIVLLRQDKLKN